MCPFLTSACLAGNKVAMVQGLVASSVISPWVQKETSCNEVSQEFQYGISSFWLIIFKINHQITPRNFRTLHSKDLVLFFKVNVEKCQHNNKSVYSYNLC
jgi:hypothetical protein